MSNVELPQIYLISPPVVDAKRFPAQLAHLLDGVDIACVRLALSSQDETYICKIADLCRAECHARDTALLIERHVLLSQKLGLDGVHLPQASISVRKTRESLGPEAIIGCHGAASKHAGMNAAEAGADYISFGPVGAHNLDQGALAQTDLFAWWSEMIKTPVIAEGHLSLDLVRKLAQSVDFFAFGQEIWGQDAPLAALESFYKAIKGEG